MDHYRSRYPFDGCGLSWRVTDVIFSYFLVFPLKLLPETHSRHATPDLNGLISFTTT